MSFRAPKGTDDVLPPASLVWRELLAAWEDHASRFGYPPAFTPIFEATDLFERGTGDATDVVQKQMYTFQDRGNRSLTLRPEGTPGVMRAYLASGGRGITKVSYSGPMFRYEQPQAGRRRQFWQLGVEYLGTPSPVADVEVIELGFAYLVAVGPTPEVRINSLGDQVCRPAYLDMLRAFLNERRERLCEDSLARIETNPLRVLDCKVCGPELLDAPAMVDHLCDECGAHHRAVLHGLEALGIAFVSDHRLVRGLDYYTRTAFEYIATGLDAAQNAVGGGGRYDGLAEALGGPPVAGVGFALGLDRIILASGRTPGATVGIFLVGDGVRVGELMGLASELRGAGATVDFDPDERSIKAQFRAAGRSGASMILVLRPEGIEVRRAGTSTNLSREEVVSMVKEGR
ncbi:MAG TPA: histidine--tRNA ligase [Acidimicrobiia bacterium]